MITNFKIFESINKEKPKVDEKTIRVEGGDGDWYVDFYFDDEDRLDYIDNKWDIKIPEWYGFKVSIIDIKKWAGKILSPSTLKSCNVYRIIEKDANKYNL